MSMDFHIVSTHQNNQDDTTPLQLVSAAQVAYWQLIEVEYAALLEKLAAAENRSAKEVLESTRAPAD